MKSVSLKKIRKGGQVPDHPGQEPDQGGQEPDQGGQEPDHSRVSSTVKPESEAQKFPIRKKTSCF